MRLIKHHDCARLFKYIMSLYISRIININCDNRTSAVSSDEYACRKFCSELALTHIQHMRATCHNLRECFLMHGVINYFRRLRAVDRAAHFPRSD